jgi:hypothetical protein
MTGDGRCDWRDCIGEYKLYNLVRSMNVLVLVLCAVNIVARIVVAAFRAVLAGVYDEAAAACDAAGSDSPSSTRIFERIKTAHLERTSTAVTVSRVLEAIIVMFMAGGFLLFFPACIVMFRRVERRLDTFIQEMNLRSDVGTVFLPFEFSPAAADGSKTLDRTQIEMSVVEARSFLGRMKAAACTQRRRFMVCIFLVPMALVVQAMMAVIFVMRAFASILSPAAKSDCVTCGECQNVSFLVKVWYDKSPELFPLVSSLCSTLPLVFSLWLMTTKEDRELMLHPYRFLLDAIALNPVASEEKVRLKAERMRMGIELR